MKRRLIKLCPKNSFLRNRPRTVHNQLLKGHLLPSIRRQGGENPLPTFYAPDISTSLSCFFGRWQALLHIYRQRFLPNLNLFFYVALRFSYLSILQIPDYHFICYYWQSLICIFKALSFARSIDFYPDFLFSLFYFLILTLRKSCHHLHRQCLA